MNKKIKEILYSLPFIITSFLPLEKANSQTMKTNAYERWDAKELTFIEKELTFIDKPNAINFGFQPIDLGKSIGYSRKINEKAGIYISFSEGKYRSPLGLNKEEFKKSYINHYKISLGTNIHFKKDQTNSSGFISFGTSYNRFNKKNYTQNNINEKALKTWSFEAGAGMNLEEKLTMGFLFDPIKGESNVYLGIPFK